MRESFEFVCNSYDEDTQDYNTVRKTFTFPEGMVFDPDYSIAHVFNEFLAGCGYKHDAVRLSDD